MILVGMTMAMVVLFTSCAVNDRYTTARSTDPNCGAVVIPPTAKVSVGNRISERYIYEGQKLRDLTKNGATRGKAAKEKLVEDAKNDILIKNGADILIAPLEKVYTEYGGKRWVVEITGYLGTYVDWDKNTAKELYFPKQEK